MFILSERRQRRHDDSFGKRGKGAVHDFCLASQKRDCGRQVESSGPATVNLLASCAVRSMYRGTCKVSKSDRAAVRCVAIAARFPCVVKREVASTAHVLVGEIKRALQATGYHAILPRHYCTARG